MNQEALKDFYLQTYTKSDLAQILADLAQTGETPPMPLEFTPSAPVRMQGRPTKAQTNTRLIWLHLAIDDHYPDAVDLATLAREVGITRAAVAHLQENPAFTNRLGPELATYFRQLSITTRGRLTPTWRAVLDLHYYSLALKHPGMRLPLYTWHAAMFGKIKLDKTALQVRDAQQMDRIFSDEFTALLDRAGWPRPEPITKPYDPIAAACNQGCLLLRGWFEKCRVERLAVARALLPGLTWQDDWHTYIEARTTLGALAQIIGTE